ncbi:MAG: hypothetical protein K0S38_803 [Candidatus Paceibacter sp.]|nr:hypothetical protein [Candidatus Paceibacter sp.]
MTRSSKRHIFMMTVIALLLAKCAPKAKAIIYVAGETETSKWFISASNGEGDLDVRAKYSTKTAAIDYVSSWGVRLTSPTSLMLSPRIGGREGRSPADTMVVSLTSNGSANGRNIFQQAFSGWADNATPDYPGLWSHGYASFSIDHMEGMSISGSGMPYWYTEVHGGVPTQFVALTPEFTITAPTPMAMSAVVADFTAAGMYVEGASTPEPTAIGLAGVASVIFLLRRR